MATQEYHRKQAQVFARLALSTTNAQEANRFNLLAMEHLGRAAEQPIPDPPLDREEL